MGRPRLGKAAPAARPDTAPGHVVCLPTPTGKAHVTGVEGAGLTYNGRLATLGMAVALGLAARPSPRQGRLAAASGRGQAGRRTPDVAARPTVGAALVARPPGTGPVPYTQARPAVGRPRRRGPAAARVLTVGQVRVLEVPVGAVAVLVVTGRPPCHRLSVATGVPAGQPPPLGTARPPGDVAGVAGGLVVAVTFARPATREVTAPYVGNGAARPVEARPSVAVRPLPLPPSGPTRPPVRPPNVVPLPLEGVAVVAGTVGKRVGLAQGPDVAAPRRRLVGPGTVFVPDVGPASDVAWGRPDNTGDRPSATGVAAVTGGTGVV